MTTQEQAATVLQAAATDVRLAQDGAGYELPPEAAVILADVLAYPIDNQVPPMVLAMLVELAEILTLDLDDLDDDE